MEELRRFSILNWKKYIRQKRHRSFCS